MGLPTGQDIAGAMGITPLAPIDITSGPHEAIIQAHGFDTHTPLSYYISPMAIPGDCLRMN
jgi:hypothetical protein